MSSNMQKRCLTYIRTVKVLMRLCICTVPSEISPFANAIYRLRKTLGLKPRDDGPVVGRVHASERKNFNIF